MEFIEKQKTINKINKDKKKELFNIYKKCAKKASNFSYMELLEEKTIEISKTEKYQNRIRQIERNAEDRIAEIEKRFDNE